MSSTEPHPEPHPGPVGRDVRELSDEELERQGKNAHDTRNWVFLHGTAEQFATHTTRMLALEQEYLRRYPKRTWQGTGGAADASVGDTADQRADQPADPVLSLLARIAAAPGGRMHKLEMHQAAREVGLDRTALASLYTADPALLVTDREDRVLTEAGRRVVAGQA